MDRQEFLKDAAMGSLGLGLAPRIITGSSTGLKKQNKPNIIFIQCDQFRAGLNKRSGYPLDITPFMDSLARSGVWFDKAYCASPSCVPSRQATWTGRWPTATEITSNGQLNQQKADFKKGMDLVIKGREYRMAAIGKMYHTYLRKHPDRFDFFKTYTGLGEPHATNPEVKKFNAYLRSTDYYAHFKPAPFPTTMQQPYRMVTDVQHWINSIKGQNNPFFIYLSFVQTHNPYQASEPYYSMFPPDKLPPLKAGPQTIHKKGKKFIQLKKLMSIGDPHFEERLTRLRSIYVGMMRFIDDQVKRLVDFLKQQGLYENTVLVFTADHGDYAGEYGLMKKGAGVPESLCRVPMWWHGAGIIQQSAPHSAHVSNTDIMPTICDMLGVPFPRGVQGRSLWPLLSGQSYPEDEFDCMIVMQGMGGLDYESIHALNPYKQGVVKKNSKFFDELNSWTQSGVLRMLRKDDWKLVYDMQRRGRLYHLPDDPAELNDLYGQPQYKDKQMELLQDMLGWELRTQDPLPLPRRYVLKHDPRNYYAPYQDDNVNII
jgi:arylsulfatase A-like enzyme